MSQPGEPEYDPKDPAGVSPKVTASTLGSLAASVALALVILLTTPDGAALLGGLPAWATVLIITAAPPVVAFLSGYAKTDPARR